MSYTYLQEQGEESSAGCFSDIPQYVLSRLNLTAERSCSNDNEMESCPSSQSGMMSAPSMESPGEEELISSVGDSLAKTSQMPAMELGSRGSEADFGKKWLESLAKYDQATSSWRTHQHSLFGGLEEFLETWPQWGMMLDGEFLGQIHAATTTKEAASGLLPTPIATDWKGGTTAIRKDNGRERLDQWRDYVKIKYAMTYPHPTHSELRMGWPIEWTDLKPLEMDRFRQWQQKHSKY